MKSKRIQGAPICVSKNAKLIISQMIVRLFYEDAEDFKDMRYRTSGPEDLIHFEDYDLIKEALDFIK